MTTRPRVEYMKGSEEGRYFMGLLLNILGLKGGSKDCWEDEVRAEDRK